MIQKSTYRDFSLAIHEGSWRQGRPVSCQFELTFSCPLHCRYCYSDCYNAPRHIKKEMSTRQVYAVLDKLRAYGIFWVCFTGGDPLARKDFPRIYAYARKKGFIVSVFTSGALISKRIAALFKKYRPFCVELTVNTLDPGLQDSLAGTRGSLVKIISGIKALKKEGIPFKVKSIATNRNRADLGRVRRFCRQMGAAHLVSTLIFPRLDGDTSACGLRLAPEEAARVDRKSGKMPQEDACSALGAPSDRLFRCNAGSDTFHVDPYGKMFLCTTVRRPAVDILRHRVEQGLRLFRKMTRGAFEASSRCRKCSLWRSCYRCPGRALLETKDMHSPVAYFCQVAQYRHAR